MFFSLAELQREIDEAAVHEAFEKHFDPQPATQLVTQPTTQPATQKASPPAPPAPLQQPPQITTEPVTQQAVKQEKECAKPGNTEKTAEKAVTSNDSPVNTSPLSTIPRPYTMTTLRKSDRLSTVRIQYAPNLAPLSASQHAQFFAYLASLPGYNQSAEEIKATGQR